VEPKGEFTESLWDAIKVIYNDLINHCFVLQLADGTLPYQCFAHYLAQDILYIKDDSIALENISERANTNSEQTFFKSLAQDGIEIERALHRDFLEHFKVSKATIKSPVIENYTHFLINHSEKSHYKIAVAALLPCFWVYNKVGNHNIKHAAEHNIYKKWIDTYQGKEYEIYTNNFIQIVEELANGSTQHEKNQMRKAFIQSTKFELYFFDEAINMATPE
jgi:thiaminase/transcriptional activator TenA